MPATEDLSGIPTYRSRAIVRDLQALAANPRAGYGAALGEDPALCRFADDIRAGDWHRIAEADPNDLAARLPDWREQGRMAIERENALLMDYAAAQAGDGAARDRLRAPEADGGHGEPVMAWLSTNDRERHHDIASIESVVAVAVDRENALHYELGGYYDGPPWADIRDDDDDAHYGGPTYG